MLERALPIAEPKIALAENHVAGRGVSADAFLHGLMHHLKRVLRALGALLAAGGALS